MGEKPILFSGPMIRALLDGRKVQTRRILKPQPEVFEVDGKPAPVEVIHVEGRPRPQIAVGRVITHQTLRFAKGDRLYVRETWQHAKSKYCHCPQGSEPAPCDDWMNGIGCRSNRGDVIYRADGETIRPWRPGIHMPRWASRLTLTVTDVRVQRLQAISKDDVIAEGISERDGLPIADVHAGWHEPYAALWDAINGAGSWYANPWVVALTFTVERANIDSLKAAA